MVAASAPFGRRTNEQVKAVLLNAAAMIRDLHIVLDTKTVIRSASILGHSIVGIAVLRAEGSGRSDLARCTRWQSGAIFSAEEDDDAGSIKFVGRQCSTASAEINRLNLW